MRDGWGLYPVTVALQSRPLIQSHTPHPLTVAPQSLPPLTPLTSFPLTLFTTHNPNSLEDEECQPRRGALRE